MKSDRYGRLLRDGTHNKLVGSITVEPERFRKEIYCEVHGTASILTLVLSGHVSFGSVFGRLLSSACR